MFVEGVHYFTPYTGPIVLGILVVLVVFIVLWRLLRTYSGIIRFSSFVDLERVAFANVLASLIVGLIAFALDRFNVPASYIMMPSYLCILYIFIATTLLMWMERVIVKTLYDVFRRNSDTQKAFIYGIRDGGVALAKDIRSQNPLVYELKGFVAPDTEDNIPDLLLGVKVYKDDEDLLDIIDHLGIKFLIVSPLQVEHIREKADFVDSLIKNGIHILMQPEAEEWKDSPSSRRSILKTCCHARKSKLTLRR